MLPGAPEPTPSVMTARENRPQTGVQRMFHVKPCAETRRQSRDEPSSLAVLKTANAQTPRYRPARTYTVRMGIRTPSRTVPAGVINGVPLHRGRRTTPHPCARPTRHLRLRQHPFHIRPVHAARRQ